MLVKVLVAIEDEYRLYRETMAETLEDLRPGLKAWTCDAGEIRRCARRLRPDVVICGRRDPGEPGDQLAWVELSLKPGIASKIYLDGHSAEQLNLSLVDLLSVIDGAEAYRRSGGSVASITRSRFRLRPAYEPQRRQRRV